MEDVKDDDSLELKYLPNRKIKRKKKKFDIIEANDTHLPVKRKNLKLQAMEKE